MFTIVFQWYSLGRQVAESPKPRPFKPDRPRTFANSLCRMKKNTFILRASGSQFTCAPHSIHCFICIPTKNQLPLSCQPFFDYKCIYFVTKVQREDWVNDPLWRKRPQIFSRFIDQYLAFASVYSVAKKEIKKTAPLKVNLRGKFLIKLFTRVIFAILAYCYICSYAAKK